jgi:acyl-CoA thioester hydrolase
MVMNLMTELSNSSGPHQFEVRVYFEDTDTGGIVYYANYLRFIERARTELLRGLGIESSDLMRQHGIAFAVRKCTVDYLKPAVLDDILRINTDLIRVGGASLDLRQTVSRGDVQLVSADIKLGSLDLSKGKPKPIPRDIRNTLERVYATAQNEKSEAK